MKTKTKKQPLDVDDLINGKSVSPPGKKKKHLDLTEEIKQFLDNEVTMESVKRILLRINGPFSQYDLERSTIAITKVSKSGYFILITCKKREYEYYFHYMSMVKLGWTHIDIATSDLKTELRQKIYEWLAKI